MVENLADIKRSLAGGGASSLLDFYDGVLGFDKKLQKYTLAKCAYERNMETCILEYLYFNNRSRELLSQIKTCREQSSDLDACVKSKSNELETLKAQVTAMIEINKKEINEGSSNS